MPFHRWAAEVLVAGFGRVVDPTAVVGASHLGVLKHCPRQCSCPPFVQEEFNGACGAVVDPTAARNSVHRPLRCANSLPVGWQKWQRFINCMISKGMRANHVRLTGLMEGPTVTIDIVSYYHSDELEDESKGLRTMAPHPQPWEARRRSLAVVRLPMRSTALNIPPASPA